MLPVLWALKVLPVLPVLPVLVRSAARQHADARALLQAARGTRPGDVIAIPGAALVRSVTNTTAVSVWADDPATGKRRNLTAEEDRAFWAWATVEVLRATGIRAEELVQVSHHSFVQYRLPGTGELVPLLQIVPSKTDAERLLVISPELADVLSAIISRIRGASHAVPLVAAYDDHERVWLPPAPVLFQRRIGAEDRAIPAATIRKILTAALARTRLTGPSGAPLNYTPHDFRRMFPTDAKMSGVASDTTFPGKRDHGAVRACGFPPGGLTASGGRGTRGIYRVPGAWLRWMPGCGLEFGCAG